MCTDGGLQQAGVVRVPCRFQVHAFMPDAGLTKSYNMHIAQHQVSAVLQATFYCDTAEHPCVYRHGEGTTC